ncbi:response regulator [Paenibacillus contaminans]|uniref:DNA-binding response regulator n=1 Tax=Paenibacillus contaminans TaxID=450362 RepID=A0A329MQE4_9BACL|nr:response regulator [Paenibacillus contaminans]RAV21994.1 DNA-binding response regulator [Paenibacillus contaminans]
MIRAMLIDDEEHALDLLEILLNEIGGITIVGRFMNPFDALERLEELQADAVFLDIEMPGMSGVEAARRIKAANSRTQLVFTTAYSEYALEAFEINAVDYLLKPATKKRLTETVSRLAVVETGGRSADVQAGASVYVQSLGGFQILTESGPLPWKTSKVKELCAFLIHQEGKYIDAAVIIESLWPEADYKNARTYFYTCISFLRKSFQEYGVQANVNKNGGGYAIEAKGLVSDVAEISAIADMALTEEGLDVRRYDKLISLHKGEYLAGDDFGWAVWRREELNSKYILALRTASDRFMKSGKPMLAADSLHRILALSPDSERDGRELIKLYINEDKRNEAINVYRQLNEAVWLHLGVELEKETVRLYESILT